MSRTGDTFYRLLLRAFPPAFRSRHGDGMLTQFRAQRDALRGRPFARLSLWCRAIADALVHGMTLRREQAARDRHRRAIPLAADVRDAVRRLRREPGVTSIIVTILAVGIAATTVMIGVVDELLLQPPVGIGHADDVRRVHYTSTVPRPGQTVADRHGYPIVAAIRDGVPAFAAAAATHLADVTLGAGPDAQRVTAQLVDGDYFTLLEVRPSTGRFFAGTAANTQTEAGIVLSHGFWRRAFGGDPAIVGRQLLVENTPLSVIGVAAAGFQGLEDRPIDLWVPTPVLAPTLLGVQWATNANRYAFGLVARLRSGVKPAIADEQATAALIRALQEQPQFGRDWKAFTAPLNRLEAPNGIPAEGKVGLWVLGVAAAVLLVAIANVVSLLLTRAFARRREIAMRIALGASRGRLLRQEFVESALLTAIAAIVAVALTWAGRRLIESLLLPNFAWSGNAIDFRVLGATLAIAIVTAFVAAMAPAMHAISTDALAALRTTNRGVSRRSGWFRSGLLVSQLALSVVLLIGAGLFIRSLTALRTHDVGIDLDRVILTSLPDRPGMPVTEINALYADAASRLAGVAGIERVSIARGSAPMSISQASSVLRDGWTLSDLNGRPLPTYTVAGPEFLDTLGATIERGRGLSADDDREKALVVVINRALAAAFWPDVDPLGQCVRFGNPAAPCSTIVGIVENVLSYDRANTSRAQMYLLPSHPAVADVRPRALLVRSRGEAAALVPSVRQVVQSLRPAMPFVAVATLAERAEPQLQPWRLGSAMFMLFGSIALVIATVGLFSAMAYAVSQQSQEIGIRMALGASAWQVVSRVCRRGAATVAAGAVLGLFVAWLLSGRIADLLYQTSPTDSIVFVVVAGVLAIAGLAAAVVPARRSTRVDPLIVLKTE